MAWVARQAGSAAGQGSKVAQPVITEYRRIDEENNILEGNNIMEYYHAARCKVNGICVCVQVVEGGRPVLIPRAYTYTVHPKQHTSQAGGMRREP